MSTCRLIVCEKSSRWAPALRSALDGQPPAIAETRSLRQAEAALSASPASLVALEVSATNLAAMLESCERMRQQFTIAYFVALLTPETASAAPLLREAGAINVATSVIDADRLARVARRHFALAPATLPLSISELLAERLPWSAYSTQI